MSRDNTEVKARTETDVNWRTASTSLAWVQQLPMATSSKQSQAIREFQREIILCNGVAFGREVMNGLHSTEQNMERSISTGCFHRKSCFYRLPPSRCGCFYGLHWSRYGCFYRLHQSRCKLDWNDRTLGFFFNCQSRNENLSEQLLRPLFFRQSLNCLYRNYQRKH